MKPFWHPLSTLLLDDPRCFATPTVLRMLLRAGAAQQLVYAGDRMWPSVGHGARVTVEPWGDSPPARGEIALAFPDGIPDLLRIDDVAAGRLRLTADADPATRIELPLTEIPGRARLASASRGRPPMRRLMLDLGEAWAGRPDGAADPAETVLDKYDAQAPYYARTTHPSFDPRLLEEIRRRVPAGGRLLVVGSGAGAESFALADAGYEVTGIDFSPAMIELARQAPEADRLPVTFEQADIRSYEPGKSFAAIVFTYDVYSFIPLAADRVRTLTRMREWLEPGGAVLLSARLVRTAYQRLILTLQWLRRRGHWGATHTRWIAPDGRMNRSFVKMFGWRGLTRETSAAGFRHDIVLGGHQLLLPD